MRAVVLAGGSALRLGAVYQNPAQAAHAYRGISHPGSHPAADEIRFGIDHVTLTVGHLSSLLRTFFQDGEAWAENRIQLRALSPLGPPPGRLRSSMGLDDTFLVTNGDVLTTLRCFGAD